MHTTTSRSSVSRSVDRPPVSRWLVVLVLVWLALGTRLAIARMGSESLAGDLALPAFAFFVTSALLASRAYVAWLAPRPQ